MDRDNALDTYRYLRGGIPVMLVILGAALIIERAGATCWQTSISAYYFTSAHGVFIGAVCAIGTLLIVYKGSNDTEDILLNLAGILAFVAAFVPTSRPVLLCGESAVPVGAVTDDAAIGNVWALVVALVVARVASWWMYRRTRTGRSRSPLGEIAVWVQRAVLAVGLLVLMVAPEWFVANAHGIAAVTMFASFIVTVLINAFLAGRQDEDKCPHTQVYHRVYQVISLAMALTLVAAVTAHLVLDGFNHTVLVVEVALIVEFGAYWLVQTVELWNTSTRDELVDVGCRPVEKRLLHAL
jgi:cytochrome b561